MMQAKCFDTFDWLRFYLDRGLIPVPLEPRSKKPKVIKWPDRSQGELLKEIKPGDNLGIRLDGLTVLDFDEPELWRVFFPKARSIEELAQHTWIAKTGGGGYHIYLRGEMQPMKCEGLIDIKSGRGHQVVAPPSIHPETGRRYEWITDVGEVEIAELTKTMEKKIKRVIKTLVEAKPIITEIADHWRKGVRHNLALSLAGWLRKRNFSKEKTEIVIEAITAITGDEEFRDRLRAVEDTFKKPRDRVKGFTGLIEVIGEDAKDIVKRVEPSLGIPLDKPFIELEDGRLAELAYDPEKNEIYYLVYDPRKDEVTKTPPIEKSPLYPYVKEGLILLPSDAEEYGDESSLFEDIIRYRLKWHKPMYQWEAKLDALYAMATYLYDLMPNFPYRRMLGDRGLGKSTWLKTLGFICYRPMIIPGASSDASLKRLIDRFRGTLLIDESDFNDSTLYATIIKILNVGFDRQLGKITNCDKEDPNKIEIFNVYGPKLLTNREPFKDTALESRCITTNPIKDKTRLLGQRFLEETRKLRNKLILWRFRRYHELKEKVLILEEPDIQETLFPGQKIEPRIAQILAPLWLIGPKLRDFIHELGDLLTERAKSMDYDGFLWEEVKDAVRKLINDEEGADDPGPGKVNLVNLVNLLGDGAYEVKLNDITDKISPDLDLDKRKGFNRRLSKVLQAHGCIVKPGPGNARVALIPRHLIDEEAVPT